MPTTFNWIYRGTPAVALDPTEGPTGTSENAGLLVGTTFGSTGSPLYNNITSATMINNGGNPNGLDNNNNNSNDQYQTDIGAGLQTFTHDATVGYNAVITYADGTTANVTVVLAQSTTGQLFFAPDAAANPEVALMAAKPIVSITIGTVINPTADFQSDRVFTAFDNGWVDGTGGANLINSTYVEPAASGSDVVDGNDQIIGAAVGDDRVRAGAGNDTVLSGVGADLVYGGTGDDSLSGQAGNDTIYGEDGNDRLYGGDNSDVLIGGVGTDILQGDAGTDLLYGGNDGDLLSGGADIDTVYGDAGNDTLYGDVGNDSLFGGTEADLVYGGNDLDTVFGDAGTDTLYGDAGNDLTYGGTEADLIYGGADQDTLYGDAGNDLVSGDAGNDLLFGGIGNDTVLGGTGRDTLYGGAGTDQLFGGDDQDAIFVSFTAALNDVLSNETLDGGSGGTDNDTLTVDITGFGWARIDLVYDPLNGENGTFTFFEPDGITVVGTLTFTDIENLAIVCFTAGTRIMTVRGPVAVEELLPGEMVLTRDNGPQPLRWVGQRRLSYSELKARPELQPIRIGPGALRAAGPERSMLVSPQHRVLIEGARAEMYFGECEVLVPAKHLSGLAEVSRALPAEGVTYVHILFDRHEIVLSDGIWTESFQPAERTLSALDQAARDEVLKLFPQLTTIADAFPSARLSLKAHEARVLVAG